MVSRIAELIRGLIPSIEQGPKGASVLPRRPRFSTRRGWLCLPLVIALLGVFLAPSARANEVDELYVDLVLTNQYGDGTYDPATRTNDEGDVIFVVHNHGTAEAQGVTVSFLLDKLQADYGYNTPPPSSVRDVRKSGGQERFTWVVGIIPAGGSASESLSFGTRRNSGTPEPPDATPYTVGFIRAEAASQNVEPSALRTNNVRKVYQLFGEWYEENWHISGSRLGLSVSVDDLRPTSGSPDVDFELTARSIEGDCLAFYHPRCVGAFTDIEIGVELSQGLKFKDGWTPPRWIYQAERQNGNVGPRTCVRNIQHWTSLPFCSAD